MPKLETQKVTNANNEQTLPQLAIQPRSVQYVSIKETSWLHNGIFSKTGKLENLWKKNV
jgi:hypothetical protein